MMKGTSPSITASPAGGYVVAFQTNNGVLGINTNGTAQSWADTELGMMKGTSPSIAALPAGGYVVAFQTNTGVLGINTNGTAQSWADTELGMMKGTSPSITASPAGGYVVAFQTNTGVLGINTNGTAQSWTDTELGPMAGTSPNLCALFQPTVIRIGVADTPQTTSATLVAYVNPHGSLTTYHFDYGTSTNYGLTAPVPDGSAGSGTGQVTVSQTITGLQPNTVYNFRLTATNEGGTTHSYNSSFATVPLPPIVSTQIATNIEQTGATLNGEVNPFGGAYGGWDRYYFQYGLTSSYGSQIPNPYARLSQPGWQSVSQQISGLQPGTTYHFRLVAENFGGISYGKDVSFNTPPDARTLQFDEQTQEQSEWCWAATTVSIAQYYDSATTWTQCTLVNRAFNLTDCCQDGGSDACNQPGDPAQALPIVGHLSSTANGAATLATVISEINGGHPISVGIYWTGGGGHNPAISGYDNSNPAAPVIDVQDPFYGPSTPDFNTFPGQYEGGASWADTYYTK
jgi:hypothetical protein